MRYAQFFITDHRGQVEKLGSDGVAPLDGRFSQQTMYYVARSIAKRYGYSGYQLRSGESYSRARNISDIIQVENG